MKQRPILFSTPMVEAILEGRKTQTRRVIKLRDGSNPDDESISFNIDGSFDKVMDFSKAYPYWEELKCPYGQPGDVLWVRESCVWVLLEHAHDLLEGARERNQCVYKASMHPDWMEYAREKYGYKWKPSIHMPREACRLFLGIKNLRAERISQISDADCIAEGIECVGENLEFGGVQYPGKWYRNYSDFGYSFLKPRESFITLWQSINGVPKPIQETVNGKLKTLGFIVYPFNDEYAEQFNGLTHWKNKPLTVVVNPWVWVIEFERVEGGKL